MRFQDIEAVAKLKTEYNRVDTRHTEVCDEIARDTFQALDLKYKDNYLSKSEERILAKRYAEYLLELMRSLQSQIQDYGVTL